MSRLPRVVGAGQGAARQRPVVAELERWRAARREETEALNALLTALGRNSQTAEASAARADAYLSPADVARVTGYAPKSVYNMISSGTFRQGEHYFKVGGRVLFKPAAVRAFVEGPPAAEADPIPLVRSAHAC